MKITKNYLRQVITEQLKYLTENEDVKDQLVNIIKQDLIPFEEVMKTKVGNNPKESEEIINGMKDQTVEALNRIEKQFLPLIENPDVREMLGKKLNNAHVTVQGFKKTMDLRTNFQQSRILGGFIDELLKPFDIENRF